MTQGSGGPPRPCLFLALGKTVARLRVLWFDSSSSQPDRGREKAGSREVPSTAWCSLARSCLPPGHPWPQRFMDQESLPPAWLQLYC